MRSLRRSRELATKVGFADFGVGAEGGGMVLKGDAAGFEDVAVVGDFEGEVLTFLIKRFQVALKLLLAR